MNPPNSLKIRVTQNAVERAHEVCFQLFEDTKPLHGLNSFREWVDWIADAGWNMPEKHEPTGAGGLSVVLRFPPKGSVQLVYSIQKGQPVLATVMRMMP